MEPFTTLVLAGGASSRMGTPKALLRFGHETAIERVVRRLAAVSCEVVIVSGAHLSLPEVATRVVHDPEPLLGPLAAIRNGLRAAASDLCFVCGCDQPLIVPEVAVLLAARAAGAPGAVAIWNGYREPLVAAYRRSAADVADGMLRDGELRAQQLAARISAVEVGEHEIRAVDPRGESFVDLDTPEAYREALRMIDESEVA